MRQHVASGSPLEPIIGFSRAVRTGPVVVVAGTAPIAEGGGTAGVGDVPAQTRRCFDIALAALAQVGAGPEHVTRTRMMLTDITRWREAADVHGEYFRDVRPACTFVEVKGFIDPDWLVEVEIDAYVPDGNGDGAA
ncbi:MAG: RidA family protein [Ilumatobacteraceae bacterium]|nr:RidA family protein [Ilumatobacter sp.]MCO5328618.1 RidA family protein [Ilumatobacteraceae bacterium]